MLPIVLIHGFPLDGSMWTAQRDYLLSSNLAPAVIAPDLPGFGSPPAQPAPPPRRASIDDFADFIHTLIQQKIEGGKAIVGGLSMGGYVLLALLRSYPEDVAAAMLIDTRADADSPDTRAARLKSIEDIKANGPAAFIETQMTRLLGKRPSITAKKQLRTLLERQSPAAMIAAQSAMARRRDQNDLLAELKIPVLIVEGSEDAVTPPSVAIAMQSHMPHAMLVQIVNSGHMTPIEQPDAVNAAIKSFLATTKT